MINGADLFCGAGGTSTGLIQAAARLGQTVNLLAINHWDIAIATHSANHPGAEHRCESLDNVDPRKAVPSGKLDILCASPECTHHSRARGGKPMSDQSRSSAWHILRWAEALDIDSLLIENVPEFQDWGPLDKNERPIKRQKGRIYRAFLSSLRAIGYNVDARVINTADYGDPTTRKRLFIMARKHKKVRWPEPTHHQNGGDMFGERPKWVAAREIIDWTISGKSIFDPKRKPLADNTLKRIEAGLRRYCKLDLQKVQPFLVEYHGSSYEGGERTRSLETPLPTIDTSNRFGLVEPFIVPTNHGTGDFRTHSLNEPFPTVTGFDALALAEPFIVQMDMGGSIHDLDQPMNTITSADARGLVEPFLIEYYGSGGAESIHDPLNTVTGRDRFGLVEPMIFNRDGKQYMLDIRFRMLQPHELSAAMSFPKGYQFTGNREQKVKQIGNAVPVSTASQLCYALLQ